MRNLNPKVMKTCAFPLALAEKLRVISQRLKVTELSIVIAGLEAELKRKEDKQNDQ